jgi:membrane protease YdiL (CAAX protease family)
MTPHLLTLFAFTFLALALCAVWAPSLSVGRRAVPPWLLLWIMAAGWGLVAGVLRPVAIGALLIFCGAAWATVAAPHKLLRLLAGVLTALLALALAMHKLPGFQNPVVIANAVFSEGAAAFTQYANFDKGAVGLVLLALLCRRTASWAEFGAVMRRTAPLALATVAATLAFAVGAGFVRPEFKLPQATLLFLAVNLLFTVAAEEAFFRGFLQARLAASLSRWRSGSWLAVLVSAALFGAAHLGGGALYGILAFIAGIGYALAYHLTQRIEAAIMVHIVLNAVHFIGFTYPYSAVSH